MTVALSSLRVTSEFDASGYARGAAAKVAADERMIAADRARNAALAQVDAALAKAIPGMAAVSRVLLEGYGAGQQFEGIVRRIGNAVDRGMGLDRAEILLDGAYRRFGLTADAAALAERGFVALAPTVTNLNDRFARQAEVAARAQVAIARLAEASRAQSAINASFGIGAAPATESGATFSALADRQDQAMRAAERLRAQLNPLNAEFVRLGKELANYRQMQLDGIISTSEFAAAQGLLKQKFADFQSGLATGGSRAVRGISGELTQLSFQLNDVATSLLSGASPFMVMAQQGGQVLQVFQTSRRSVGDLVGEAASRFGGLLTAGRVAFGGIALTVGASVVALNSFLSAQNQVALALTGAGRAGGVTTSGINLAARAAASLPGLSVSEAQQLASALAQTGAIGADALLPIVKMGKEIAVAFGVDAKGATDLLARAFADPVAGADQLNQRLGFLDASMQRQIQNLVAQNRISEAQRLLAAGVRSGLEGVAATVSATANAWTIVGNAISNATNRVGEFIAKQAGLSDNLEQRSARLKDVISGYETGPGRFFGSSADLENFKRQLADVTAQIERQAAASREVADARRSLQIRGTVTNYLPELQALQDLVNNQRVIGAASEDPALMRAMGLTQAQLYRARSIINDLVSTYRTAFDDIKASSRISLDAVVAFSPSAKADIARRQTEEQLRTSQLLPEEKRAAAELAYQLALKQSLTVLSESARARMLAAEQGTASARLDLDLVGKSIEEQTRLRAIEQSRQQLQQESSQNRTAFNQAELDRLSKVYEKTAALTQLEAERAALRASQFDARTALLPGSEQQIASQLRNIYGDQGWQAQMTTLRMPKATTPIHELERRMRCKPCSEMRGYSYKRASLVALRCTPISADKPASYWWPPSEER